MVFLIWFGCIAAMSIIQTLLSYAGISGALPTLILGICTLGIASAQTEKYLQRKAMKKLSNKCVDRPESVTDNNDIPPILYCRKCGKRLTEGCDFCKFCGTEVKRKCTDELS